MENLGRVIRNYDYSKKKNAYAVSAAIDMIAATITGLLPLWLISSVSPFAYAVVKSQILGYQRMCYTGAILLFVLGVISLILSEKWAKSHIILCENGLYIDCKQKMTVFYYSIKSYSTINNTIYLHLHNGNGNTLKIPCDSSAMKDELSIELSNQGIEMVVVS